MHYRCNRILTCIVIGMLTFGMIPRPCYGDESKWLAIGMLHDWFSSGGCEMEVGRRHLVADQEDGLTWPALFEYQDIKAAKGLWIGARDFYDPILGQRFEYKVIHCGPRIMDEDNEIFPSDFCCMANSPIRLSWWMIT